MRKRSSRRRTVRTRQGEIGGEGREIVVVAEKEEED